MMVRWSGGQVKVKYQKFTDKSLTLMDSKLVFYVIPFSLNGMD